MLVIVNPNAAGGHARRDWERIRPAVVHRLGLFDEYVAPNAYSVRRRIRVALDRGEHRFVAVGGDGTVNLVVNVIMELASTRLRRRITVGAVGLGSSNDFHKTDGPPSAVGGVPARLDFAHPIHHDVGTTAYVDAHGDRCVRYWVINASVGTTAQGNLLYNDARGLIGAVKRCSSSLGMVIAALGALFGWSDRRMTMEREDGRRTIVRLRNLGVVKNPNFTGCLRYDSPYEPGSGDFFVHLLADSSWRDTAITLFRLARGRFAGRQTTETWRARWVALMSSRPFPVEGDGEIVVTHRAEFSIEPRALQVCS